PAPANGTSVPARSASTSLRGKRGSEEGFDEVAGGGVGVTSTGGAGRGARTSTEGGVLTGRGGATSSMTMSRGRTGGGSGVGRGGGGAWPVVGSFFFSSRATSAHAAFGRPDSSIARPILGSARSRARGVPASSA